MRAKKNRRQSNDGPADWLLTYSDMVTLLLCFFVLLYTFSVVDAERFMDVIIGLRAKLGVLDGGRTIDKEDYTDDFSGFEILGEMELSQLEFETLFQRVSDYIEETGLEEQVKVVFSRDGLIIRFIGRVLFDIGKAELKEDSIGLMREMAVFFADIDNYITVEGHTDNWPIKTEEFPTNWELSTARATTVVRFLIESLGLPAARFTAAGQGEYNPVLPNTTEANRAQNRRVDLVIRRTYLDDMGPEGGRLYGKE